MRFFLQDLRIGGRVLLKEKSFFLISVLVLALGIGGVTTMFSVIDSALIRGLPFPDSDRLVRVALRDPTWAPERSRPFWLNQKVPWESGLKSVEGLAGYFVAGSFIVTIGDVPQRFTGSHVTDGFFSLLRVKPALGRDFTAGDHRLEAPRVTIISDALWQSDFGHDPQVLGRVIRLNGKPATVVGVMPPGFSFPRDQLWLPMFNEYPLPSGGANQLVGGSFGVLARLNPGFTFQQASAEFTALARRTARDFSGSNRNLTEAVVEPLLNSFVGRGARQLMFVMLGAVVAVLLIACVNVMNMQFARATRRAKELAVRGALGASRARLTTQMLTESLLVALAGGLAGALLAAWAVDFCSSLPRTTPAWIVFQIDGTVLAFTLAATGASVLASGFLPAFIASRTNTLEVLKAGDRGHTSRLVNRLSGGLVVGQIALTAALLVASLLLVKSVNSRYDLDFGFDLGSVLAGRMNFETDYRDDAALRAVQSRLLTQLRASPQFAHAAFSSRRNSLMTSGSAGLEIESRPDQKATVALEIISDGYFETLGLRPLAGREFEPTDTPDKPTPVLVNTTFAKKYFPGQSALGLRLRSAPSDPWYTIVGVVPDTLMQGPMDARGDGAGVFLPTSVFPQSYATLVVRGRSASSEQLVEPLRREILRVDPNLAIYAVETPQRALRNQLAQVRTAMQVFSAFGLVAIVLSAVGLYGIAAFSVNQRTQEFGIRIALGAAPRQIMEMVLRQGAARLVLGCVLGVALALVLTRIGGATIDNLLYKVSPHDPATYALVVALLALAMLVACFVPARRATKVDPMIALRAE